MITVMRGGATKSPRLFALPSQLQIILPSPFLPIVDHDTEHTGVLKLGRNWNIVTSVSIVLRQSLILDAGGQ